MKGQIVFLLLPRAEPQKVVEALRSAGKARPLIMPGGIERLDDDYGIGLAVPITLHWRSGSGSREPPPMLKPPEPAPDPAPRLDFDDE